MGEIAVLQPQDLVKNRYPPRKLNYSAMKPRRKSSSDGLKLTSNRRRKSPTVTSPPSKPTLVMGQVKILKRGEALTEINNNKEANYQTPPVVQNWKVEELDDFVLSSTDRLGPEPELLTKKVSLVDFYAGSGVIDSPAPSSLPVPRFFVKKVDPASEIRHTKCKTGANNSSRKKGLTKIGGSVINIEYRSTWVTTLSTARDQKEVYRKPLV